MMKRTLLTITTILAAAIQLSAQCWDKQVMLGGTLSAGTNWVDNLPGSFSKASFGAGLSFITARSRLWAWGADLTVDRMGFGVNREQGQTTVNPTYLRLPLRGYYFITQGPVRPMLYFGPEVGLKLSEHVSGVPLTNDASPQDANWDAGFNAGAGLNIRAIPNYWINVAADYYRGFTDVPRNIGGAFNYNRRFGGMLTILHNVK